MSKKAVNVAEVEKANIAFAIKNQAFNALMFVFRSFVSVFRTYESEERAKELMDLFKPLFDNVSKEFVPDLSGIISSSHGEEGHESDAKTAYKG